MIHFGTFYFVSFLIHLFSATFQMLPVTHFTETLLEAVEDELEVRGRSPTLHHTQPFFIS